MTGMRKTSMGYAKAHFSELCQLVAVKGQRILILRHGKPAVMIVPVDGAAQPSAPRITAKAFDALVDRMIAATPPTAMTIEQALGRDRLDRTR
jgi:antitoxin (DNA-binding transcriptional repressor) of toxin-antitoxin stability system